MSIQHRTQDAIRTLTAAFAPFDCLIQATRKGNFSFTIVDQHGVACHSERLYPEQYDDSGKMEAVINRVRKKTLAAWAVAEAECNTVTGLKQVHHAATPLPLS
ncbi:Uncharacterised protein [Pseudomonas aeruginosa]|nr:Uncharacterised protein [Pseudomonas aeruginosa]